MLTNEMAHRLYTDSANCMTTPLTGRLHKPVDFKAPLGIPTSDVLNKRRIGPESYLQEVKLLACKIAMPHGLWHQAVL